MKKLIFIFIFLSIDAFAVPRTVSESRSFKVGHQNTETLELLEVKVRSSPSWELRHYSNGYVTTGRAITKKTYEKILADWDKIFTDKKEDTATCDNAILVVKTIEDGMKRENVCSSKWSKNKKIRFKKFYTKLKNLASETTLYYE